MRLTTQQFFQLIFSGILFGITNTIGNMPGFIGPAIAGAILDAADGLTGWKYIFSLGCKQLTVKQIIITLFGLYLWEISIHKE